MFVFYKQQQQQQQQQQKKKSIKHGETKKKRKQEKLVKCNKVNIQKKKNNNLFKTIVPRRNKLHARKISCKINAHTINPGNV